MTTRYFLKATVGSWSGGTQVEIVDEYNTHNPKDVPKDQTLVDVRVLAGDKPLLRGLPKDICIVERTRKFKHE